MPPQNPTTPPTPPPAAPMPAPEAAVPNPTPAPTATTPGMQSTLPTSPEPKSGSKLWLVLIGVVVLLMIIGGGVLYYLNMQQAPKPETSSQPQASAAPASQVNDLNNDLNATDSGDVDSQFQSTDKDLQGL